MGISRVAIGTLGAAVVLAAGPTASAAGSAPAKSTSSTASGFVPKKEPGITGAARVRWLPGDDVEFAFDAKDFAFNATGTFSWSHASGGQVVWARGSVDCLIAAGGVATLTGVITATDVPALKGVRQGWSVEDVGHRQRIGFTVGGMFPQDQSITRCTAVAPFATLESGGFKVVSESAIPPKD